MREEHYDNNLLTSGVARLINRSAQTVRSYERRGWLNPKVVAGIRIFDRTEAEELARRLADEDGRRKGSGRDVASRPVK